MNCVWSIVPYTRRLVRPIVTAHGVYQERSGFLLTVRDSEGIVGLGDVAPLPGFSLETLEDTLAQWSMIHSDVSGWDTPATFQQLSDMSPSIERATVGFPALRFGLETALADLASRRVGLPLAKWLREDAAEEVEVNALLAGDDPDVLAKHARSASTEGFQTFKIKVAVGSVRQDLKRVMAVRDSVPHASIRLDANEGWTESSLQEALPLLSDMRLEFLEQPLPVGQADLARNLLLRFGVPLALDEDISSSADATRLIADRLCDGVVLKPMVLGGLLNTLALADLAAQAKVKVIFTSTWETDVGLAATLHLACAIGPTAAACGLSTAGMIAEDLVEPALKITNGHLSIANHVGLGLRLSGSIP